MDIKKFFQSTIFKIILAILAGLIILSLVFAAGLAIGFGKARFSYQWGENYQRNFGGPRGGFMRDFRGGNFGRDFTDAHGVTGQIIKIDGNTVIMKGRDGVEKIVLVNESADIKKMKGSVKISDLKVEDMIIVIGEPDNQGRIEAKFIRLMPAPPASLMNASSTVSVPMTPPMRPR